MHEFSIPSGLSKNFWITPGMTFFTNDSLALYSGISSISGPQIASLLGNSINFSFGSSIMRYNEFASVANGLVQYTPKKSMGILQELWVIRKSARSNLNYYKMMPSFVQIVFLTSFMIRTFCYILLIKLQHQKALL